MDEAGFAAQHPSGPEFPPAPPERLPFSRQAIWGFVIACVSLFVFGFIGALGATLSARGFRETIQGRARGRGLAIAGIVIGAVGFLLWVILYFWSHFA